jgi:DNA-binding GntR family transcriptional regulator
LIDRKVVNLDENVYGRVFDAILEQKLAPGTRLNEEELTQIFSVSRTVIRKALVRLTHDGIVETRQNKGARLATVTPKEAQEILEARRLTEGVLVKLACVKSTATQIAELNRLIQEEEKAEAEGNHGKSLRMSGEFHFKISQMADNQPLAEFARKLISKVSLVIAQFEKPNSSVCVLHDDHHALVDAIAAKDSVLAEKLMHEHIKHIEDKLSFNKIEDVITLREAFSIE